MTNNIITIKCQFCGVGLTPQYEYVNGRLIDINNTEEQICEDCRDDRSDCLENLFYELLKMGNK